MIVKRTFKKLNNTVAKSFFSTLQKLPFEEREQISDDFARENFDLNDSERLDSWVTFYYKFGRFPGSQELVILPQIQTPDLIGSTSIGLSPIDLYKKFNTGESKGLVSLQALAALLIHFGGERITAKRAMDEWQSNLLFQTLSKENDGVIMQFEKVGKRVYDILRAFSLKENEYARIEEAEFNNLTKKLIDTPDFEIEEAPEITQLQDRAPLSEVQNVETSTPIRHRPPLPPSLLDSSPELFNEDDSAYLKTAITISRTNLDATIEAVEEKNKQVLRDIVDPTPGLITNELFTETDQNRNQEENETNIKLNNEAQSVLNKILDEVSAYLSLDQPIVEKISFPKPSTDTRDDFEVSFKDKDIEVSKTALKTKITTNKKSRRSTNRNKRSPYFLRKRKFDHLMFTEALKDLPLFYENILDEETSKVNAVESIVDSIVKQIPEHKKLKLDFGDSNDIKITEL